jgi:class 3 adenylate cyclase
MSFAAPPGTEMFDCTVLAIDIRGWSEIVFALGPERSAELVDLFWDMAEPLCLMERGEIYSRRGDGLLVAFEGERTDRLERALRAAKMVHAFVPAKMMATCWEKLEEARIEAMFLRSTPELNWSLIFSFSTAVTDGRAAVVERRAGRWPTAELTADHVNLAFAILKNVPPNHLGTSVEVFDALAAARSPVLDAFVWDDEEQHRRLAGAQRRIRRGHPITPAQEVLSVAHPTPRDVESA